MDGCRLKLALSIKKYSNFGKTEINFYDSLK